MKNFNSALRSIFLASLVVWPGTHVLADDTEIYFARATADNTENKPVAKVMIMLDTSGSMRNCETGSGSNWCSTIADRRITLLHEAMKQIIEDAPDTVEIGFGRFQGSQGGKILLPVMPVNELTKPEFLSALDGIDEGQDRTSPGNVQPSGGTPTSLAYEEMANYMLGRNKGSYVSYSGSGSVCVSNAPDQEICRDEVQWSDPVEVTYCDPMLPGCTVNEGWEDVPYCDVSDSSCRLSSWSDWQWSPSCSPRSDICDISGRGWFRQYRTRSYLEQTVTYELQTSSTVQVCEVIEGACDDSRSIVSGNSYVSPINTANQCESNHIIMFTDGTPSGDSPRDVDLVDCNSNSYDCQARIASYLYSNSNSAGVPISTHNIGLYMSNSTLSNMTSVSNAGGGETYGSDSADSLLAAFQQTLDLIDEDTRSITAPGVAVNTMNRFQHLNQLYYSVFRPVESSYWEGNLKRYYLDGAQIEGVNGNAIDPSTGFFREGSRSFWSSVTDGADVQKGGARDSVGTRRLFYTDQPGGALRRFNFSSTSVPANEFLGLSSGASTAQRTALTSKLQTMWGDPLHSVPVLVNYGEDEENNYVFVSNNGGMLHGIKTSDGSEAFSFMPYEFISKANEYTVNRADLRADNSRQNYGLDGSWIAWRRPGDTSADAPASVYIYGGMRRGGRSYYALDVTDPSAPEMLWQISNETAGFEDLGQTWSTPTLTSIPSDSGSIPVLVFGGGYSPADHDNAGSRSAADRMGNAIYVVNASTGALIWSAGSTANAEARVAAMKWAVPGGISVVDMDFDGVADFLYFADLGGQVFRVGIDASGGSTFAVERLASLSTGAGSGNRRFFEAPAVAYVKSGAADLLYVALGSGYRAHPLDEVTQDGFFVIKDEGALQPKSQSLASTSNMSNVTSGGEPSTSSRGWYYTFEREGEKSMSSALIYNGRILFTTYAPTEDDEDDNVCAVRYGQSFLHTVALKTGLPAALTDDAPTPTSRSQALQQTTPAPTPSMIINGDGELITLVGTEVVGEADPGDLRLRKRRWMQLPKDDANVIRQQESPNAGE